MSDYQDNSLVPAEEAEEDGEFGGFEMADEPATTEAQPLPPDLQIVQNSWLLMSAGSIQSDIAHTINSECYPSPGQKHTSPSQNSDASCVDVSCVNSVDEFSALSSAGTSPLHSEHNIHNGELDAVSSSTGNNILPEPAPSVSSLVDSSMVAECHRHLQDQAAKHGQLQQEHRSELLEMRKAAQDALTSVVQQYQESCKASLKENEAICQLKMTEFVESQQRCLDETLHTQQEMLHKILEDERLALKSHLEDSFKQEQIKQQEMYEKLLQEERLRIQQEVKDAIQQQQDSIQKLIEEAVQLERDQAKQMIEEEREKMRVLIEEEREKSKKSIREACELERCHSKKAFDEYSQQHRTDIEAVISDTLQLARQQIQHYVDEHRQEDLSVRLRLVSSVDVLLNTAHQQIQQLMVQHPSNDKPS